MRFNNRIVNFGDTTVTTHLSDDQLMETCVLAGDNRHLAECRPCKARFDELVRSLQQMHEAAVSEADTAFSADRLHDQRDRIMRRIERHDHPAEVVAFPHHGAPAHSSVNRLLGPARRWVAGAAAAGLAAGVFLGFAMDRQVRIVDQVVQQSKSGRRAHAAGRGRRSVFQRYRRGAHRFARARNASRLERDRSHDDPARNPRSELRSGMTSSLVFRKGLDLKDAVAAELNQNYYSDLVQQIKADDFQFRSGRLTIHLAREFGFCYGVDRAVDYAYQTRERFPDRRVFLTGEIIHNPHVNDRLRRKGIQFLSDADEARAPLGPDDVVVLPAFGVTTGEMQRFTDIGCVMVDTTCGSVLNVWKNVKRYAQDGFTSVIHGKVWHEETQATASQALTFANGHFLVVLNLDETNAVCDYIRRGGDRDAFLARFRDAMSPGFDPDRDLEHIGLANQTTMLMSESLEVQELFRQAMTDRYGTELVGSRFRAFDTICSATQDRQDAVVVLLKEKPVDLMIVIGGYNSSNTCNLARMCAATVPTFHIANPDCLESADAIRYRPSAGPQGGVAGRAARKSFGRRDGCPSAGTCRWGSPREHRPPTTRSARPSSG